MKRTEIENLPHDEIEKLSLQKNKYGVATKEALIAQRILCEESGAYRHKTPITLLAKKDRSYYSESFY